MANRRFNQFFNTLHKMPVLLDCHFAVDSTAANGIGTLRGGGVQAVYMHSSSPGASNPNPAAGLVLVQLQDNYNKLFGFNHGIKAPNSGASLLVASAGLTVGQAYAITIVGTTTTAAWIALGVPRGIVPAVGVPFVAAATSALGTGAVQLPATAGSGIVSMEVIGNSNLAIQSTAGNNSGASSGSYLVFRTNGLSFAGSALGTHTHNLLLKNAAVADGATTRVNAGANLLGANTGSDITVTGSGANGGIVAASAGTPAGSVTLAQAAPADGSIIHLQMYLSNSAILVQGE